MSIFSRSSKYKNQGGILETPDGFGVANKKEAQAAVQFHEGLKSYANSNSGSIPTGKSTGDGYDAVGGTTAKGYYYDEDLGVVAYGTYVVTGKKDYDNSYSDESIRGYKKIARKMR